jgi:hypothetical protein
LLVLVGQQEEQAVLGGDLKLLRNTLNIGCTTYSAARIRDVEDAARIRPPRQQRDTFHDVAMRTGRRTGRKPSISHNTSALTRARNNCRAPQSFYTEHHPPKLGQGRKVELYQRSIIPWNVRCHGEWTRRASRLSKTAKFNVCCRA